MSFADHFSQGSSDYATFRPRYPEALFAWLAEHSPGHALAWDCATGSGQAASGLVAYFDRVVATDASEAQIAEAVRHERIEYRKALADGSGLADASADLVTVAQALHWLPLERFFHEAARVLVPGGLLAVWGYTRPRVSPGLDKAIDHLHDELVGPWWPEGRQMVEEEYRSVPFPFRQVTAPRLAIEQRLSRDAFLGYLGTWSAVRRYVEARGGNPVDSLTPTLEAEWPADERRLVHWPLFVRAGCNYG